MYKHIPFKYITNKIILPKSLISYVNTNYIDPPHNKHNNYVPIIYTFPSLTIFRANLGIIPDANSNQNTTLPNKPDTNASLIYYKKPEKYTIDTILSNQFDTINNVIYCRNIQNSIDTMILGRIWFKYIQEYNKINFVSIYECVNNIDNPNHYREMSKYWRKINNNKIYPDFESNTTNMFLSELQELY
jgi:hypothetical protein